MSSSLSDGQAVRNTAAIGRAGQIATSLGLASTPERNIDIASSLTTGTAVPASSASYATDTGMDDLYEPLELEFLHWARSPQHTNKARLSHLQRREYRWFLTDTARRPVGPKEGNMRQRALRNFLLIGGQLYRKAGDELDDPDDQAANQPRRVIMVEAAFTTIRRTHELIGPHAGVTKSWAEIQRQYYGINKEEVQWVIRNCDLCQRNRAHHARAPLQMIKSSCVNERWCIDLFDMRTLEYNGMKWCFHCKDAVSKRSALIALPNKQAQSVCNAIYMIIMMWGVPLIIQSDNGGEFKAVLLWFLRTLGIKIINGNPHKPTTQGLVEQANGTVESRLNAWMEENNSANWPLGCLHITLSIDITLHSGMNMRPYQVMFAGRMPYLSEENWLNVEERALGGVPNEDGSAEDNEETIDFQVRIERSAVGRDVSSASRFPCARMQAGKWDWAPYAPTINFEEPPTSRARSSGKPSNLPTTIQTAGTRQQALIQSQSAIAAQKNQSQIPSSTAGPGPATELAIAKARITELELNLPAQRQVSTPSRSLQKDLSNDHISVPSGDDEASVDEELSSSPANDKGKGRAISIRSSKEILPRNYPPGASKDALVDTTVLKARKRQTKTRERTAQRYSKKNNTLVLEPGTIMCLRVPKAERVAGVEDKNIYVRVLHRRKNTYQLQTKRGILKRYYGIRDLGEVSTPLAKSIDQSIPNTENEITLRQAVIQSTNAIMIRVSCRCKGTCDNNKCSCRRKGKDCSIYCHPGNDHCGHVAAGPAYNEYALVQPEDDDEDVDMD